MHWTGKAPLVVILGPTAVGKTGLALEMAEALNGEIIGADSRQVYRYMDIGTAKPTPEQRARVQHHCIDLVEPDYRLSLAEYQRAAYAAIADVTQRGRLPCLVGGTGQYVTAVIEGWVIPAVAPNEGLRAELEAFAEAQGAQALHDRLQAMDPTAAGHIDYRNIRRVIRAIEVTVSTGEPMSQLQQKQAPPYRSLVYGLTLEREVLYAQADQRIAAMVAAGFVDEVRRLLGMGYPADLPSMSGLGYREISAHLLAGKPLETALEETRFATRDFIRRQYTWFKGHDPGILWHNSHQIDVQALIQATRAWLSPQD